MRIKGVLSLVNPMFDEDLFYAEYPSEIEMEYPENFEDLEDLNSLRENEPKVGKYEIEGLPFNS